MSCNLRNVKPTIGIRCHSNTCFRRHGKIVLNLTRVVLNLKGVVLNLKGVVLSLKRAVLNHSAASDSEMLISRDQAVIQSYSPVHQLVILEKYSRSAGLFLLRLKSLTSLFLQG